MMKDRKTEGMFQIERDSGDMTKNAMCDPVWGPGPEGGHW